MAAHRGRGEKRHFLSKYKLAKTTTNPPSRRLGRISRSCPDRHSYAYASYVCLTCMRVCMCMPHMYALHVCVCAIWVRHVCFTRCIPADKPLDSLLARAAGVIKGHVYDLLNLRVCVRGCVGEGVGEKVWGGGIKCTAHCVCVCVRTHVRACVCSCVRAHTGMHTWIIRTQTHIQTHACTHIHTRTRMPRHNSLNLGLRTRSGACRRCLF